MIVKCIDNATEYANMNYGYHVSKELTIDKLYIVIKSCDDFHDITNDNGVITKYYKRRFKDVTKEERTKRLKILLER